MEKGGSVGWSDARSRGLFRILAVLSTLLVALAISPSVAFAEVDTSGTPTGYWGPDPELAAKDGVQAGAPYWVNYETKEVVIGSEGQIPGYDSRYYHSFPCSSIYGSKVSFQDGVVLPENCTHLFQASNIKSIDLHNVDFSKVETVETMFDTNGELESIDLRGLDFSHVKNAEHFLSYCDRLETVNMSGLDLSGMKYAGNNAGMSDCFCGDSNLKSVDMSGCTLGANSYFEMFWECEKLETVNFDGIKVVHSWDDGSEKPSFWLPVAGMFSYCKSLKSIDLSNFDTSGFRDFSNMFYRCSSLEKVDLGGVDTSDATNMGSMFSGCTSLQQIKLSDGFFNASADLRSAAALPDVTGMSGYDVAEHTGKWVRESGRTPSLDESGAAPSLASDSLMAGDATDAGTWVWQGYATLSFNANGGEGTMDAVTAGCGDTVQLAPCTFGRKAYDFAGWSTEPDGSGTSYADGAEVPVAQDTTFYAQWKEQAYTLTYDPAGGTWADGSTDAISRTYGKASDPATILDAPVREGYVFVRWEGSSPCQPGDVYGKRGEDGLLTDDTLTAVWEKAAAPTPSTTDGGKAQPKADRTDAAAAAAGMPDMGDASIPLAAVLGFGAAGAVALAAGIAAHRRCE